MMKILGENQCKEIIFLFIEQNIIKVRKRFLIKTLRSPNRPQYKMLKEECQLVKNSKDIAAVVIL